MYARGIGLIPRGPDPVSGQGGYIDPVTGQQRVLIHREEGHFHINTPAGERLDADGRRLLPRHSRRIYRWDRRSERIDDA